MVDDHSRLAYSEILPDEKGPTCAGVHPPGLPPTFNLRAFFEYRTGHHRQPPSLPPVDPRGQPLSTDSGARHLFIKPHCPWQNGKVERFNRTLQAEWSYRRVFSSNDDRARALAPWLEFYNTQRRHSALDGLPPISRL